MSDPEPAEMECSSLNAGEATQPEVFWLWGSFLCLLLVATAVGLALWVPINHDEGWVLLAGQSWLEGRRPNVDYAFPQGPWLAAVYGWGQGIFGAGLLGGRTTSVCLTLSTGALGALAARRTAKPGAAGLLTTLLILNPVVLAHLVIVKGYALGAFFLALSLVFLSRPGPWGAALGAGVLALGALSVRLSLVGPLLALVLVSRQHRSHLWLGAALGAGAGLLVQGPAGVPAVMAVLDVHLGPYGEVQWQDLVTLKTGLLASMCFVVAPAIVVGCWSGSSRNPIPLGWMVLFGLAAQLVPGTHHGHYVVLLWPLVGLWACREGTGRGFRQVLILGAAGLHGLWGLVSLDLSVERELPGRGLREIAAIVEDNTKPGELLLGFHPIVAVHAGRHVHPGLELGYFSLSREVAPLRLTPVQVLEKVQSQEVGAVLVSSRSFLHDGWNRPFRSGESMEFRRRFEEAASARFCKKLQWDGVGQFKESMTLYLRGRCP